MHFVFIAQSLGSLFFFICLFQSFSQEVCQGEEKKTISRNLYDQEVTQKERIEKNMRTWESITFPGAIPHYKEHNNFVLLATDTAQKYASSNLL